MHRACEKRRTREHIAGRLGATRIRTDAVDDEIATD